MAVQDEVPKSRLTLRYKTEINGQTEDVNLPLRMLVMGDFSLGTSADRKLGLEERKLRSLDGKNLNTAMKDMNMSVQLTVANKVDPDKAEDLEVNMPIRSMKSFSPDEIVKNIPKLKGLMMLKRLLTEIDSNVSNSKDLRKVLTDLYANEENYKAVLEQLKGFESFKLPTGKKADAAK
jgi:type VI secretion system protein ImpB